MPTITNNTIVQKIQIEKNEAIRQFPVQSVAKLYMKSTCPNMFKANIPVQRRVQKNELCSKLSFVIFVSKGVSQGLYLVSKVVRQHAKNGTYA